MKTKLFFLSLILILFNASILLSESSFYSLKATDINGDIVKFDKFKNQVLLITNFSSKCGTTPQLQEFQKLSEDLNNKNFKVLAFASEDFAPIHTKSSKELKHFCKSKFGVNYDLFKTINVKGENIHPVYKFLTTSNNDLAGSIGFNAEKFLVNKEGNIVNRYGPFTGALSKRVVADIKEELK